MEGIPLVLKKRNVFHMPDQRGALGNALPKHFQHLVNFISKSWPGSNYVQKTGVKHDQYLVGL